MIAYNLGHVLNSGVNVMKPKLTGMFIFTLMLSLLLIRSCGKRDTIPIPTAVPSSTGSGVVHQVLQI